MAKKGARSILVSNRSFDRAVELATQFGGRAVRFEDRLAAMAQADIVVASTACPKTLLHRADIEDVMQVRRNRPLILIDISVPRNVAPDVQQLDDVYLYNIDDLNAIVCENMRTREQELALCNQLIEARAAALMEKINFTKERPHETGLPFPTNWLSHGAAVGAA
jgi:glutamyl-tRNA reductase